MAIPDDKEKLIKDLFYRDLAPVPLREKGKEPMISGFNDKPFTSLEEIKNSPHWKPNSNVGISTRLSRIVVIDADNKKGKNGVEAFYELCKQHDITPDTYTTQTPNDGLHFIYRNPNGHIYKSNQDKLGDGIDVIGDGGCLMAPDQEIDEKKIQRKDGSWHIKYGAGKYHNIDDSPIAVLPDALAKLMKAVDNEAEGEPKTTDTPKPKSDYPPFKQNKENENKLEDSFNYLNPECSYNDWIKIAWAHKCFVTDEGWSEDYIKEQFKRWSAKSKVHDPDEAEITYEEKYNTDVKKLNIGAFFNIVTKAKEQPYFVKKNTPVNADDNPVNWHKHLPENENPTSRILNIIKQECYMLKLGGTFYLVPIDEFNDYRNYKTPEEPEYDIEKNQIKIVQGICHDKHGFIALEKNVKDALGFFFSTCQKTAKTTKGFDFNCKEQHILNSAPDTFATVYEGTKKPLDQYNCPTIDDYLEKIICNNSEDNYQYVLRWIAHIRQFPHIKPEVSLILRSTKQGTGKGHFHRLLKHLFGPCVELTTDVAHVVGDPHNGVLARALVITMDEATKIKPNKIDEFSAKLKSLVVEPTVQIRKMRKDIYSMNSGHRFVFLTNNDNFKHVAADDRRDFYLVVSDARAKDRVYYSQLNAAFKNHEIEEFMGKLEAIDLSDFDPTIRPDNLEHDNQVIDSLKGFERFIFDIADSGFVCRHEGQENFTDDPYPTQDGLWIPTNELEKIFSSRKSKYFTPGYTNQKMHRVFGEINSYSPNEKEPAIRRDSDGKKRGFDFGSLDNLRQTIAAYLHLKQYKFQDIQINSNQSNKEQK